MTDPIREGKPTTFPLFSDIRIFIQWRFFGIPGGEFDIPLVGRTPSLLWPDEGDTFWYSVTTKGIHSLIIDYSNSGDGQIIHVRAGEGGRGNADDIMTIREPHSDDDWRENNDSCPDDQWKEMTILLLQEVIQQWRDSTFWRNVFNDWQRSEGKWLVKKPDRWNIDQC